MRKRRVYLIAVVLVVAGVLVGVFAGREREPEYGGKRLSEWVEMYADPDRNPSEAHGTYFAFLGINWNIWLKGSKDSPMPSRHSAATASRPAGSSASAPSVSKTF